MHIGISASKHKRPVDIKLSLNNQELIVLFDAKHFSSIFNLKGKKIRNLSINSNILVNPHFLCLDLKGNFIISNL